MSIKQRIKFKENKQKEDKSPSIWINEDEEFAKHLAKFFKGHTYDEKNKKED